MELPWEGEQGALQPQHGQDVLSEIKQLFPLLQRTISWLEISGEVETELLLPLLPLPETGQQLAQHPQPLQDKGVVTEKKKHKI